MGADNATSLPVSSIFIDESSQTDNRFLVLGGVIVPAPLIAEIDAALLTARLPELPHGEMKWAKVSKSKIEAMSASFVSSSATLKHTSTH